MNLLFSLPYRTQSKYRYYDNNNISRILQIQKFQCTYDFYVCIPVLLEQTPENAVPIPACTALSLLVYGNYSNLNEAHLYLGEQARKHGLTPSGYIRAISLVGPYVGKEIDPNMYCSQLVLPIKEV